MIWNSQAGTADRAASLLDEIIWLRGITVHFPASSEEARRTAYNAALGEADIVVAAGGDGTVHDVLQGLVRAKSRTAFAAIPLGTGNDFCRNSGIPLEPPAAFELLMTAQPEPLDLIRVSTDQESVYCVNMASGGNSGNFSDLLTSEMKKWWGPLVYLRGALDVISHLQVFEVQLAFNDEPFHSYSALNVFVANGPATGGGLIVAPDAEMDDGLMNVVVVLDCTPVDIAALAAMYAITDYRENPHIICRRVSSMRFRSDSPVPFSVDGELLRLPPREFTVLPHAVRAIMGNRSG